jgi:hypothetical protein
MLSKAKYNKARTLLADALLLLDPHAGKEPKVTEAIQHIEQGAIALVRSRGAAPQASADEVRAPASKDGK